LIHGFKYAGNVNGNSTRMKAALLTKGGNIYHDGWFPAHVRLNVL